MDNMENINIIIKLLKVNKIRYIVISPGGTNIPFVKAVQDDDFFTCYSVVDERSAIYFAIGLYLQTNEIIATSCTSAQATRNYVPGLTEAFYKRVPILAITMSKHPRFTYQEYMQAPDQTSLPKDCIKQSFLLPFICQADDVLHSIRLVNQAIQLLTHDGNGPVQLCVPWRDFLIDYKDIKVRSIQVLGGVEDKWDYRLTGKKILLVVGEHMRFAEADIDIINKFCESNNVAIYVNHLSNFHNAYTFEGNLLFATMQDEIFEKYIPDIMITIGGQTGDYPLYNMLSKGKFAHIEHWRVSEDGKIIDTYDKLTKVFKCSEHYFFSKYVNVEKSEHSYFALWSSAMKNINLSMELPYSNASIAQYLHDKIPQNSIMQFSILNSLRIWNFFPLHSSIECYSNVAAFGIDGGMSTLIGQSVVTDKLSIMIVGDLAFFYDMNAIGIRHIKSNLRILLINNNGGIEFKFSGKDNEKIDRFIAAGNHYSNACGWAEACGFTYLNVTTMEEFRNESKKFLADSDKPILMEAFVKDVDEAQAYDILIENNRKRTAMGKVKYGVKSSMVSLLGEENYNKIKGIFR